MPNTSSEASGQTVVHTNIKQPDTMSWEGSLAENWRFFKQKFDLFLKASRSTKESSEFKTALLLSCIGDRALKIYNNFSFASTESNQDFTTVINKFEAYFNPEKNVTYERHIFLSRNKKPYETMEEYITDLRDLSSTCDFGTLTDSLITSKLILGLKDDTDLQNQLIRIKDLTLSKAEEICKLSERTKNQLEKISNSNDKNTEDAAVHRVKKFTKNTSKTSNKNWQIGNNDAGSSKHRISSNFQPLNRQKSARVKESGNRFCCYKCGNIHRKNECPAFEKNCVKCNKKNHFAKMCKSIKEIVLEDSDNEEFHIDSINEDNKMTEWSAIISVHNNTKIKFKLDTGAQVNIIPAKYLEKLNIHPNNLINEKINLITYTGQKINCIGKCKLISKIKNITENVEFYIVDEKNAQPLLGKNDCEKLNLIKLINKLDTKKLCENYDNLKNDYKDVFTGIGCLKGTFKINLNENYKPVIHSPRKVPIALQEKLKNKLKKLQDKGIIAKVNHITEWVNPLVIVNKPNGDIRICMDPKDLNKSIKREYFLLPEVDDILTKLNGAKYFSILDASEAFYQIKLDFKSSLLCTFATPYGRYRFCRLPYGITLASEVFHSKIKMLFEDLDGIETYIDDFLIWGETKEIHDERLRKVLNRCKEINLKLNFSKCRFGVSSLIFLGHKISDAGIEPDHNKVVAIKNFKTPENKKDVERFLGMITYVSKFIHNLSEKTENLRKLIKKDASWSWEQIHKNEFEKLKLILCSKPVLQYYNQNKPLTVSVDSSKNAVGAVLLQNNLPVYYASKSLTESQKRWAPIEKEAMAICFGLERFHHFVFGKEKVIVESDHKPLSQIFKKPLHLCPPRLQRMFIQIQKYDIDIIYKPGSQMYIADALSRAHDDKSDNYEYLNFDKLLDDKLNAQISLVVKNLKFSDKKLSEIKEHIKNDEEMNELIKVMNGGWPQSKSKLNETIKIYFAIRDELFYHDGLIFRNSKIIIPKPLRKEILKKLHLSHLGKEKTKNRAREIMYWPGLSRDIDNMIANCDTCARYANSNQKQPIRQHDIPERPWQKVAMDLFEIKGKHFLCVVDYFSKYPEVVHIQNLSSESIIIELKNIFARQGIPDIAISDNGPQFNSHLFKCFSREWDFTHITSSPKYPKSNGMVERTIQTIKNIFKKSFHSKTDPFLALLELRNTPIYNNMYSPSQVINQRQLKSLLPVTNSQLKPIIPGGPK